MNNEFKKSSQGMFTRYVLESDGGTTGASSIASIETPVGGMQRRQGDNLIAQEGNKDKVPATTPRNFVAKNAKTGGAGAHKDKKKSEKQGNVKHKKPFMEGEVVGFPKKHRGDLEGYDDCPKCGGELQGGKYMGREVKVCQPCKQVYLPPNSGIDTRGNEVAEDHEIQMASSELQSIAKNAEALLQMVRMYSEQEGLEAWQQSKITKAADYLNSVLQSISGEQGVSEGADDTVSAADKVEDLVNQYKLFDKRGWTDFFAKLAGRKLAGAEIYREMEYASKFLQLLDSIRMRSEYRGQQNPKLDQELVDLSNQWLGLFNKATSEFKGMGGQGVAEGLGDTQKKIEDTINKLEDRLKHAKSDEQWDRISARIERLQAGLNRSKQGVAEGAVKDFADDLKALSAEEFQAKYKMSKAEAREKSRSVDEGTDYMMELAAKLAEKIPKNAPVDVWIKDFAKSNAPQFRGKNLAKRKQMAIAASYDAKNPSKKK